MVFTRGLGRVARMLIVFGVGAAGVLMVGMLGAQPAAADDRIPDQVAEYCERHLVPRLTELYAPGVDGASGIDFDETTSLGAVVRVRAWTEGFLADAGFEPAYELTNAWLVPVSVNDEAMGLATVWVNPATTRAELADFELGGGLPAALATIPLGSVLVRHAPTASSFAVADGMATPIVAGSTGIRGSVPLPTVSPTLVAAEPQSSGGEPAAIIPAVVLIVVLVGVATLVLLPSRRRASEAQRAAESQHAAGPTASPRP